RVPKTRERAGRSALVGRRARGRLAREAAPCTRAADGRRRERPRAARTRSPERTRAMSESKPQVSEHEARAVAEGAREPTWAAPSFVRELFLGRLDLSLIHPCPEPDAAEQARAGEFMAALERFLATVDAERIERDARIPAETIQGLRELGAFGIK